MVPLLILGGLLIGGLILANWDEVVEWVVNAVRAVKDWFMRNFPTIVHYGKVFIEAIKTAYAKIKCRSYHQEGERWFMKEGFQEIPPSEVPADILAKAKRLRGNQEADITREMELQTGTSIG